MGSRNNIIILTHEEICDCGNDVYSCSCSDTCDCLIDATHSCSCSHTLTKEKAVELDLINFETQIYIGTTPYYKMNEEWVYEQVLLNAGRGYIKDIELVCKTLTNHRLIREIESKYSQPSVLLDFIRDNNI